MDERDIDRRLGQMDRELDEKFEEVDREIEERVGRHCDTRRETSAGDRPLRRPAPSSLRWRFDSLPAAQDDGLAGEDIQGLRTSPEELLQAAAHAFNSPHVQGNAQYRVAAAGTFFLPDLDNPEVNAFAGLQTVDAGDEEEEVPVIIILGGAANFTKLASLAVAADQILDETPPGGYLFSAIRKMGGAILSGDRGGFSMTEAGHAAREVGLEKIQELERVRRRASSYGAGMNLSIVAHELGHIALGHVLGEAANLQISRNQEREADSFASSVISSSPFCEYLVGGSIIWELAWVWCQHAGNEKVATTHPLALERLMDSIRANEEQARDIGIDKESIKDFLPPGIEGT